MCKGKRLVLLENTHLVFGSWISQIKVENKPNQTIFAVLAQVKKLVC